MRSDNDYLGKVPLPPKFYHLIVHARLDPERNGRHPASRQERHRRCFPSGGRLSQPIRPLILQEPLQLQRRR